jgi:hypothetical protein
MIRLKASDFNTSQTKRVLVNGVPVIIVTQTKLSKSKDVKKAYGFGQEEPYGTITSQRKDTINIDMLMVAAGYALDWESLTDFEIQLLDTNGPCYMCSHCEWTTIEETSQTNDQTARNIAIEIGDVVEA